MKNVTLDSHVSHANRQWRDVGSVNHRQSYFTWSVLSVINTSRKMTRKNYPSWQLLTFIALMLSLGKSVRLQAEDSKRPKCKSFYPFDNQRVLVLC